MRAALPRTLVIAVVIGVVLSVSGAFGSFDLPFWRRTLFMIGLGVAGGLLGMGCYLLCERLPWVKGHVWLTGLHSGPLMAAPMSAVAWLGASAAYGRWMPASSAPGFFVTSLFLSVAFSLMAAAINWSRADTAPAPAPPAPPRFLERLPLKLRGGELWAVEAEDHYLRLHTSRGQDLILLRLADAVAELEGLEGMQVHRSWWVARDAIAGARRGDGRAVLTLKDGSEVPVSRTYARALRDRGWI